MTDQLAPCRALAEVLATSEEPAARLPELLPCNPLDLLLALHEEVTRTMLSDLAHAHRAASAASLVAQRFPDDPLLQAQAHWTQGSAVLFVPDYAQSLQHYDAALKWYDHACQQVAPAIPMRDVRVVQVVRVFCLSELGRYDEAQQAAEAAERWLQEHPNDYAALTLLLNRSQLAGNMGDYTRMVDLADETIALATRLDYQDRVAQGWINRAYACIFLGRFAEAEAALERGVAIATLAGEPVTVARAHCNRAVLLCCRGQLFGALSALREAQHGLTQATGEEATIAMEEAALYEQLRQLPEAQRAARFAAEQFAQQDMPIYSAYAAVRAVHIAVQQQRVRTAHRLLEIAKTQAQRACLPVLNAEIALAEAVIATLPTPDIAHRTLVRLRRAARRAAALAVTILETNGLMLEAADGQLIVAALDAQLGNAKAALTTYQRLAQHSSPQIRLRANAEQGALLPPAEGLIYLQRAATLSVEYRRSLPMEELQARYSSETSPHHMRLAACHLALGDVEHSLESVFIAKAGPLLDLRSAAASLDSSTLVWLEASKADIARWRVQVEEHQRKAQHAAQQEQYERVRYHTQRAQAAVQELQDCEQTFTAALRVLGDRGGQARVPRVEEIQAALPPGMVLLEYACFEDELVGFLVQRNKPVMVQKFGSYQSLAPLLDRWSLLCNRLMNISSSANANEQLQSALNPLWDVLIAPWCEILALTTHLLIAPYGILHHVPWAALFNGLAYLGDQVTLSLTPCGALLAASYETGTVLPGPPRLLAFAGHGERHLDHIATELTTIARCLPDAQVRLEATAKDVRALPSPRLLHIAAHGLANPAAPLCSSLELADGPFLLLEAHRLNLRGTELVVLSACETSVRPDQGDMVLALAGAFLCAGARAVLASLWRVSDSATSALMESFYAALANGALPADALRRAQRQVRENHPLDWAAFQLWAGAADLLPQKDTASSGKGGHYG
jgi:CHAT domain-containing protein